MLPKEKIAAYSRRFSLAFGQVFSLRSRPGGAPDNHELQDVEAPAVDAAVEQEVAGSAVGGVDIPPPPVYCSIMW